MGVLQELGNYKSAHDLLYDTLHMHSRRLKHTQFSTKNDSSQNHTAVPFARC